MQPEVNNKIESRSFCTKHKYFLWYLGDKLGSVLFAQDMRLNGFRARVVHLKDWKYQVWLNKES